MTKLYDQNAYMKEFTAKVISCKQDGEWYQVILDRSAFFPEEGGQTPDLGMIDGVPVKNVILQNDEIVHFMCVPFTIGKEVHGVIDWEHRFRNMQMHSGEHIFSGLMHNRYGLENVGFHLSDNSATMDFNGKISDDELLQMEESVNQVIAKGHPIHCYYPSAEERAKLEYRSKKELSGPIRLVAIEDIDLCACCAPHVANTNEIGNFKISFVESYKGGLRIHYLCGLRAYEDYRKKQQIIEKISQMFSCNEESVIPTLQQMKDEMNVKDQRIIQMEQQIAFSKIEQLPKDGPNGVYITTEANPPLMKEAVKKLGERFDGFCGVFSGTRETGYRYFIESKSGGLKRIDQMLKEKYQAKGGGSDFAIQGSVFLEKTEILCIFRHNLQ